MATKTLYGRFEASSPANRRLLRQEELILEVTELLLCAMEAKHISKADLATKLGRTKGFVSQILSGRQNLTLRTLADLADALDGRIQLGLMDYLDFGVHPAPSQRMTLPYEPFLPPSSWSTSSAKLPEAELLA